MNYQTIFDLQSAGYRNWYFPAFGLVFMLILAIVRKVTQRPMMPPKFITGFCIIWIVGTAAGTYLPYRKLLAAYSSGNY